MMQLLVGLGNPGAEYDRTRHNAGFWLLDAIALYYDVHFLSEARHHGLCARLRMEGGETVHLLKPQTYMNRSGLSVQSMLAFYKLDPSQMMVFHDELDLMPGVARLKHGGGHAGHNGLRDIMARCGGKDFWRLRLGIGRPIQGREPVADFVLSKPSEAEQLVMDKVIQDVMAVMNEIIAGNMQEAMRKLHAG